MNTDGALETELVLQCAGGLHKRRRRIGLATLSHALECLRAVVSEGCHGAGDGVPCRGAVSGHLVRTMPPHPIPVDVAVVGTKHAPEPIPVSYAPPVELGPDGADRPTSPPPTFELEAIPPAPETPPETPLAKRLTPPQGSPRATLQPGRKRRR